MVILQNEKSTLTSGDKLDVLLVDDNPAFLAVTQMFLEANCRQEIRLVTACDGKQALAQAQTHQPQLILLDVSLPGMNGLETAHLIKQMLPMSHIIIMTLLETMGYAQAAHAAGADALIDKSDLSTDLLPIIRRMLSR